MSYHDLKKNRSSGIVDNENEGNWEQFRKKAWLMLHDSMIHTPLESKIYSQLKTLTIVTYACG